MTIAAGDRREYERTRYATDDGYRAYKTAGNERRRRERLEYVNRLKAAAGCKICGESDPIVLDFHHVDPSTKILPLSHMVARRRSYEVIDAEVAKCVVLCANHHRWVEAGTVAL